MLNAQLFLSFGSSPRREVHLGTFPYLSSSHVGNVRTDKPYQGWGVCLFVCLFEGPPSIYSWTTGLKKLPEHRTLEEGVPFPPLIATQQLAKLQADLEVRGQGGGLEGRAAPRISTHTRPSLPGLKACCPQTLGDLNF